MRPFAGFKHACFWLLCIIVKLLNSTFEFLGQFLVFYPIVVSQVAFVLGLKVASRLLAFETQSFMLDLDVKVHVSDCAGTEVTSVTGIFYPQVLDCHVSRQTLFRCESPTAVRTELSVSLVHHLAKDMKYL